MQAIELDQLSTVTGGANSQVSSAIAAVNSAVSSYTANANSGSNSNSLLLPIMMLAMNKRQQSVVSTPGATVVY